MSQMKNKVLKCIAKVQLICNGVAQSCVNTTHMSVFILVVDKSNHSGDDKNTQASLSNMFSLA